MRLRTAVLILSSVVGAVMLFGSQAAFGQDGEASTIVVDSSGSELTGGAEDGTRETTVAVLNVTTAVVMLSADHASCSLTVSPELLEPSNLTMVSVTTDSDCIVGAEFDFTLLAGDPATGDELRVDVTSQVASTPATTDWTALIWIPIGAGVGILICAAVYWAFAQKGADENPKPRLTSPLPGLASDWSFTDSWASTATVISSAAIGLLGAGDVLNEIAGKEPEETTAVLTVGAGISTALVLVAPIVLSTFQTRERKNSVFGVLVGAVVVFGAALGLLGTIAHELDNIFDGSSLGWVRAALVVAAIALVVYGARNLLATLDDGVKEPPAAEPSLDAKTIALAIGATSAAPGWGDVSEKGRYLQGLTEGIEPKPRARAAMI